MVAPPNMTTPRANAARDSGATLSQPGSVASVALRVLSGITGALVLLVASLFTLGTCLAAPLGIIAARRRARRRNRPFTRGGSWLGAAVASSIAIALVLLVVVALSPRSMLREIQKSVVASQDTVPAPDWLTRVFPQAARPDPTTQQLVKSPVFVALGAWSVSASLAHSLVRSPEARVGWVPCSSVTRSRVDHRREVSLPDARVADPGVPLHWISARLDI